MIPCKHVICKEYQVFSSQQDYDFIVDFASVSVIRIGVKNKIVFPKNFEMYFHIKPPVFQIRNAHLELQIQEKISAEKKVKF